jgi:ribosomal subunit interface protein
MNIIIKATNFELIPSLQDYIEKRLSPLEKIIGSQAQVSVEVGKTTNHHKNGDVFKTEFTVFASDGAKFYVVSEKADQYESIDDAINDLKQTIINKKDKKQSLWKRGASKIKDILKGM